MEKADWDDWWPRWVWVGECFFWYQLTRVVPDKFHRAVKWLRVCVLSSLLVGAVELWALSEEKDCLGSLVKSMEHDDIVSSVFVNSSVTKFVSSGYDKTWVPQLGRLSLSVALSYQTFNVYLCFVTAFSITTLQRSLLWYTCVCCVFHHSLIAYPSPHLTKAP